MNIDNQYFEICKSISSDILDSKYQSGLEFDDIIEILRGSEHVTDSGDMIVDNHIDIIKTIIVSYYYKAMLALFPNAERSKFQDLRNIDDMDQTRYNFLNHLNLLATQLFINNKNTEHIFWYICNFTRDQYKSRNEQPRLPKDVYNYDYDVGTIKTLTRYLPNKYAKYIVKYIGQTQNNFQKQESIKSQIKSFENDGEKYRREARKTGLKSSINFKKSMLNVPNAQPYNNTVDAVHATIPAMISSDYMQYEVYKSVERYFFHCSSNLKVSEDTFIYTFLIQKKEGVIRQTNSGEVSVGTSVDFIKFFHVLGGIILKLSELSAAMGNTMNQNKYANMHSDFINNASSIYENMVKIHIKLLNKYKSDVEESPLVQLKHDLRNVYIAEFETLYHEYMTTNQSDEAFKELQLGNAEVLSSNQYMLDSFNDENREINNENITDVTLVASKTITHLMYHMSLFNVLTLIHGLKYEMLEEYLFDMYYPEFVEHSSVQARHFLSEYDCILHCMKSVSRIIPNIPGTEMIDRLYYDFPVALYCSTRRDDYETSLHLKHEIQPHHMKKILKVAYGVDYDVKSSNIYQSSRILEDKSIVLSYAMHDYSASSIFKIIHSLPSIQMAKDEKDRYVSSLYQSLSTTIVDEMFDGECVLIKCHFYFT